MENKTSNISASQYSGKIANAKIPPGITRILTTYAKLLWIVHVIAAFIVIVVGVKSSTDIDELLPFFISILSAAAVLLFGYIIKTIVQGIADLFYNVNIISEMSVINTALEVEKETGTNILT